MVAYTGSAFIGRIVRTVAMDVIPCERLLSMSLQAGDNAQPWYEVTQGPTIGALGLLPPPPLRMHGLV